MWQCCSGRHFTLAVALMCYFCRHNAQNPFRYILDARKRKTTIFQYNCFLFRFFIFFDILKRLHQSVAQLIIALLRFVKFVCVLVVVVRLSSLCFSACKVAFEYGEKWRYSKVFDTIFSNIYFHIPIVGRCFRCKPHARKTTQYKIENEK